MRRGRVGNVLLALAVACASLGSAADPDADVRGSHRYRRQLIQEDYDGGGMRRLLQCNVCPPLAQARTTCSALSATELSTVRATLISNCATLAFSPSRCCALQQSSQWATYAACVW